MPKNSPLVSLVPSPLGPASSGRLARSNPVQSLMIYCLKSTNSSFSVKISM